MAGPTTPVARRLPPACAHRFVLGPLSLAATRGISVLISSPPGTSMCQFPGLSSPALWIREGDGRPAPAGFAHSETRGSKGVCP